MSPENGHPTREEVRRQRLAILVTAIIAVILVLSVALSLLPAPPAPPGLLLLPGLF